VPYVRTIMRTYGAAAPAGGTAGVFLGGVITEWRSWPFIFWLDVPISVAALLLVPAVLPTAARASGRVDLAGALIVTAGLSLGAFGVVRAPEVGWSSGVTVAALVGAVLLIVALLDRIPPRPSPVAPVTPPRRARRTAR
jgi:hypothetical protein